MGFLGFLMFALKCFDFLAWPLFALGCPLYASIRAIENNYSTDMRNLVAYWIIFSLISLFEIAFVKLIDWLPFWPYMKLMVIIWLGLPQFDGAAYVYDCLLRPYCLSLNPRVVIKYCLSLNPHVVIKYFVKPKEDSLSLNAESFLAVAERYVQENGSEALEKLIERKSKNTKPSIDIEEVKAVTNVEAKETAAATQSELEDRKAAKEDATAVELTEKSTTAASQWAEVKDANLDNENSRTGELKEKNPAVAVERVECVQPNQTEKKTVAVGEMKDKAVAAAGGENKAEETIPSEKVQKEWTCALCQVKTTSEKNLIFHLQGKKHKAMCEQVKASKQATNNKGCSSLAANQEPKKPISSEKPSENKTKNQGYKVKVDQTTPQCKAVEVKDTGGAMFQSRFWCSICDAKCTCEADMAAHLGGKRHALQIQQMIASLGGGHQ